MVLALVGVTTGPADADSATIDLEVTGIAPLDPGPICAGSSPTLRAYIVNNGTVESGFFNILWYQDSDTLTGGHFSIPAGATDTHDDIWFNIPAGTHTLTFIADFDNTIAETNEDNNEATITFDVAACNGYTAMGDSYTSGEGNPPFRSPSDIDKCDRSESDDVTHPGGIPGAYVWDVAATLGIDKSAVRFVACSGATRFNVWMGGYRQEDSQVNAVDSTTSLITISVGGDDVGFADVLLDCITGLRLGNLPPGNANCATMTVGTNPQTHKKITLTQQENNLIADLGLDHACSTPTGDQICTPSLHTLYETLANDAAPGVRIRVLLYPHLFTTTPTERRLHPPSTSKEERFGNHLASKHAVHQHRR